ncbi:MAG: hypothetical protein EOP24_33195 [Hyphomicrobiales bacterium]|nr:MAG: hypothetical protein EOP24_33195 [Hyphomicrobiales bacterium]
MSLFIEIQDSEGRLPHPLVVQVGDILRFSASGALLEDGSCIEILGPLVEAVVGTGGQILRPVGSPNVVLVHARSAGRATVGIVTGDPWASPTTTTVAIVVEP